jgi:hypothetical protein
MRCEVDLRESETATLEAASPRTPALDEVLASVAADAVKAAGQYLSETVVPHGGE